MKYNLIFIVCICCIFSQDEIKPNSGFLTIKGKHLFDLNPIEKYSVDLDNRKVTIELREVFETEDYKLPEEVEVDFIPINAIQHVGWYLKIDGEEKYAIVYDIYQQNNNDLLIYSASGFKVKAFRADHFWSSMKYGYESPLLTDNAEEKIDSDGSPHFIAPMSSKAQENLEYQHEDFQKSKALDLKSLSAPSLKMGYYKAWGEEPFWLTLNAEASTEAWIHYQSVGANLDIIADVWQRSLEKMIEFEAHFENGIAPKYNVSLRVFGETLFKEEGAFKDSFNTNKSYTKQVSKTKHFFLGAVPVFVTADIGGTFGLTCNLKLLSSKEQAGFVGEIRPKVNTYINVHGGTNLWFVQAGPEGKLDLLVNTIRIKPSALFLSDNDPQDPKKGKVQAKLQVDNSLSALSGKIGIYAKVRRIGKKKWKKYSHTLFEWEGLKRDWVLYDEIEEYPVGK